MQPSYGFGILDGDQDDLRGAWGRVPVKVFERIIEGARRHVKAAAASVTSLEAEARTVSTSVQRVAFDEDLADTAAVEDTASQDVVFEKAACRQVLLAQAAVAVDDVAAHPGFAMLDPSSRVRAYLGVPVWSSSRQVIGVLGVTDASVRHWHDDERALLEDLASCVADHVEASAERERAEAGLRHERGRLLDLLDNIPGLVFERRKTGPSLSSYTIYGPGKATLPAVRRVMERGEADALDFIHSDDREAVQAALHRSLAEECDLDLVFRIADQDRSLRWIKTRLTLRRGVDDAATSEGFTRDGVAHDEVAWDGIAYDVTDLVAAQENAASAQAGRETAIVNANHELRTPLQAIIGFSEFMKGETRPEVMADHAKAIQSAADSLLSIVNQQLDLAGGTLDMTPTAATSVALRPFAETCLSLVGPLAIEKNLASHLVIDADVPGTVMMDRQKVQQIILNLLNNAVKFTNQGSYTLGIARAPDGLRFSVADTGIGVPEEKRVLLFQRFSRLQHSEAVSGSGLGLSITKTIVQALHGRIGIGDTVGRGTTFWFEIPVLVAEGDGTAEDIGSEQAELAAAEDAGARILLADDLDLNRRLIADLLAIEGHKVDCVADGAAAVKMASENAYDLILMDMIMPGMDGIAATRAIRALPAPSCTVPIVALTANSFREQLDSCLTAGMDATLTKPMSVDALTRAVQTWTRGRKAA